MPSFDLPPWFLSLLLAPFGLVLGSFGNVLIHRLPLEEAAVRNVVTKPSHCPQCEARIRWYHNIPLLSWLVLRGKCADCGGKIPFRYPLVELLTGLLFAGSVWVFPFGTLIWAKGLICGYALIVLFFTDFTEFMLPDVIQFPLIALGLLLTVPQILWPDHLSRVMATGWNVLSVDTFSNGLQLAPAWVPFGHLPVTWKESLIGIVAGYGLPWLVNAIYKLIRKTDGLGMGDFKMLAWLGAFWGWGSMLGILFAASFLAVIFALPLLLTGRAKGNTMLPLGCFLAMAAFPIVFYGPALWAGYMGFSNALVGVFR
ncbi:MAG: prepilin peptidase [Holophaga sp.]|nr:prepilin peptidase [Holophaga sp.]